MARSRSPSPRRDRDRRDRDRDRDRSEKDRNREKEKEKSKSGKDSRSAASSSSSGSKSRSNDQSSSASGTVVRAGNARDHNEERSGASPQRENNSSSSTGVSSTKAKSKPEQPVVLSEAEEKIRQRREKLEAWRKQKAAQEQQAAATAPTPMEVDEPASTDKTLEKPALAVVPVSDGGTTSKQSPTKRKAWSLEDDDDDESEAASVTTAVDTNGFDLPTSSLGGRRESSPAVGSSGLPPRPPGKAFKPSPFLRAQMKGAVSNGAPKKAKVVFDDDMDDVGPMAFRAPVRKISSLQSLALNSDTSYKPALDDEEMPDARPSRNEHQRPPDEVDTLDAYMVDVDEEVKKITEEELIASHAAREKKAQDAAAAAEAAMNGANEEDEVDANNTKEDDVGSDPEDIIAAAAKKIAAKKKDLAQVDHSAINYEPFRKNFLVEPPELAAATPAEVEMMRAELDGIKIRGKDCPKPVQKWTQFGLPPGANEVIRKVLKYEKPTSIQAQAIPAIMSGRDVIGIAKTGSGKTIAFLLPMFRHIKDQRQLDNGEGPVGLIMTPTRELAVQIYKECKQFTKILGLRAVCAYGGSPIKDQIDDLKRGAEIIICTPGRIIDLLTANRGRVTNLRRVTYLVLDEADRMFDMGFEPQVMKIVNNVRPGRQTVLFSATFPRQMEALARKILTRPLEITVGGRSVVAADVTQIVEVRDEDTKFVRLLEILGNTFTDDPEAKVLVFVDRHEAADNLLRDLLRRGYPCQTLHGGKDQMDRDSTIADFKTGATNVLIATSVAARGLDVKQLKVVVNFECPNHMEDYVHRVGRTGRAGHKGTAYTFITSDQDRFAQDIVKALKMSGSEVAPDLLKLAENFNAKVQAGSAKQASSGFGGKGLEKLDAHRDFVKKIQKKSMGGELAEEDEDEEDEASAAATAAAEAKFEVKPGGAAVDTSGTGDGAGAHNAIRAAQEAAARIVGGTGAERAQDIIARINSRFNQTGTGGAGTEGAASFSYEIEINDYPQKARWKVTNKEQIVQITEISGAAITTRGTYIPPGKVAGPGERKLYLVIEGDSQMVIDMAKNEIKRILTEATVASMEMEAAGGGRFKVV